ncbi:HLA class II histocompatibility antigen, DP beta 1 chain-like isoform X1 [Mauremys reevesii]|uniref:HLA class II histocompatibility antigen, DP beta 1 chain-like isoform X1 n=1 Tax=Mauremys reevesii TaxID=260615 RepID=UPI00193FB11F|nr:HLA class II histocompatibility antigen, DP beta 1 chain-like isoform X1 [Mauremys reevesii]
MDRFRLEMRVRPKVKVSPTKSGSEPHSHLLVCSVTGFYPGGIEIQWLKNGQEQTAGVVSKELLQNGDWTFQILVMLEMSPRRGDVYTCQVEHVSLRGPLAVHWGLACTDPGRFASKQSQLQPIVLVTGSHQDSKPPLLAPTLQNYNRPQSYSSDS